ncbi:energy-coupling factor transporter transmembrane protein EcfT [Sinomonas sp. ASV322]|uniref:energy-coupling factor transporter transmembrane component T family protein n=1 Tax=Sinomonas sp. ASV322 TaxID=3041920 RepID=UPI0027DC114F|nr:energy-coupling factor transporter transmembrane protein EcfT [Sinomonas sp. ASV322]MDQ4500982.1 energy-coupling factor transporter transmembrane protein EcfT [Sinomonas sp. ASV322]
MGGRPSHGVLAGYVAGNSWLHRAPLWAKFLGVVAAGAASFVLLDWRVSATALGVVLLAWLSAGLGWRRLAASARLLAPLCLVLGAFQWWQLGPATAARIVLNLALCFVAAGLLTATVPLRTLLDAVARLARPFRRLGANPERFALAIAIMLRSIPVIAGAFDEVGEAARARGLERDVRARTVPVVLSAVAYARRTGEALAARGLGDGDDDHA